MKRPCIGHEKTTPTFASSHTPDLATWAPGRVNLIGGHTDYNGGLVLPIAIDLGTNVAVWRREDNRCHIHSASKNEGVVIDLTSLAPVGNGAWVDYVAGVAWALQQAGHSLAGVDMLITGDVPIGGGLSSSASLEVACCLAWEQVSGLSLDCIERARLCQLAENQYVGMHCGLMDQIIANVASEGFAALIDFATLQIDHVPVPAELAFLVCNTKRTHALSKATEYNQIRAECESVASRFHVDCVSELTSLQLEQERDELSTSAYRRARHVILENARVCCAAEALANGQLNLFGEQLNRSHISLRDDYGVSCPELELMRTACVRHAACYGARLVGAGFGGCILAAVPTDCLAELAPQIAAEYRDATGIEPAIAAVQSAGGACLAS